MKVKSKKALVAKMPHRVMPARSMKLTLPEGPKLHTTERAEAHAKDQVVEHEHDGSDGDTVEFVSKRNPSAAEEAPVAEYLTASPLTFTTHFLDKAQMFMRLPQSDRTIRALTPAVYCTSKCRDTVLQWNH
jgi:hypothetical protein